MKVLIVYAHHEPSSFTAAMKNMALEVFSAQGHSTTVSDLYAMGFNAVAEKWDFVTTSGQHFNYMLEQKHAANLELAFAPDIVAEISKIKQADAVIFVAPLWWSSGPAILKGWFDRVLAMGVAWDTGKIFETGLMRGKQAMLLMAGASPVEYYQDSGRYGANITQILQPINQGTLAFCGFDVHEPFVALNIMSASDETKAKTIDELHYRLENIFNRPQWLVKF